MKVSIIRKKIITLLSVVGLLCFNFSSPALASTNNLSTSENNNSVITNITISDPETGDVWTWDISDSDLSTNSLTTADLTKLDSRFNPLDSDEQTFTSEVNVDIGKYLDMTFQNQDIQPLVDKTSTITDDLTISIGLTYTAKASNNSISISKVFGSAYPKGLYYATNKVVYWRNPGADIGGVLYPTTNTWSYSTDSTYAYYYSSLPPYAILDCTVRISGMTAYRNISVTCTVP